MIYHTLTTDTIFSKILFSHLQLLNKLDFRLRKAKNLTDYEKNMLSKSKQRP